MIFQDILPPDREAPLSQWFTLQLAVKATFVVLLIKEGHTATKWQGMVGISCSVTNKVPLTEFSLLITANYVTTGKIIRQPQSRIENGVK